MKDENCIIKKLSSFDDVLYYRVDVIKQNPLLPLFLPSLNLKEDIPYLAIDTKGFIPLKEWLNQITPTKAIVIEILDLYFKALLKCNEYFLDAKNLAPGFSGVYVSLNSDASTGLKEGTSLKEGIKLIYYPLVETENSTYDPLKTFGEELVIYFESRLSGIFSEEQIIFLENLNLTEINSLYAKFKDDFPIVEESNLTAGFFNCLMVKIKDSLSKNSSYEKIVLKDTFILPAIVMTEIFLLIVSFSILKNQLNYRNSILPVIIVAVFITICLFMDFWLLFSHKSPLKIKSLIFNSGERSKKTPDKNPSEFKSFSTPMYQYTARLTSQPTGSKEYDESDKYYILTEDFLIGSNEIKTDMHLKYPFIDDIHARITCKQGFYYVEDLGSQSGTYLNDTRLKKHFEYELGRNAKLRFGNIVFYFSVNG
jgi:hypothetical protein